MASTRERDQETIPERVKRVAAHTQGTMPVCMVMDTQADAVQVLELLATNRKAAELISVKIKGTDQEITVDEWKTASEKRKSRTPERNIISRASPHKGRRR